MHKLLLGNTAEKNEVLARDHAGFMPALIVHQLYRIGTMHWGDECGTSTIADEVLAVVRVLMMDEINQYPAINSPGFKN